MHTFACVQLVYYFVCQKGANEVNRQYFQQAVLLYLLTALYYYYYAGTCSYAACIILCPKLCWHNLPRPNPSTMQSPAEGTWVVYGSHYIQNTEGTMAPSTPAVFSEGSALKSDQSFEFVDLSPLQTHLWHSLLWWEALQIHVFYRQWILVWYVLTCIGWPLHSSRISVLNRRSHLQIWLVSLVCLS